MPLQAMQQHVEACHALLRYTFPEDHPDVVPAVNVRCTRELGQLSSRFNEPWIPLQKRKGRVSSLPLLPLSSRGGHGDLGIY